MFDIKPEQLVTKTDKLLYNIWQELKGNVCSTAENTEYTCSYCETKHPNRGKMLACAKKCKKEGVKNGARR